MKNKYDCFFCKIATEQLKEAKKNDDLERMRILFDRMKVHKSAVKFPNRHGFKGVM